MKTTKDIKSLMREFKPSSKTINLFDPNIQETSTRYFQLSDEAGNKFKLFVFSERISFEFKVSTSLLFAVNLLDVVCFANKPLGVSINGHNVYVSSSDNRLVLDCVAMIDPEVQNLGLQNNEGLFVYRNGIHLVLSGNRGLLRELAILKRIRSVIVDNFPEDNVDRLNPTRIPTNFHTLLPFLAEWAIADDLEREEKIETSSNEELKTVIDAVSPKIHQINDYLSSFGNEPLTYEVALLSNLAELVSEHITSKK